MKKENRFEVIRQEGKQLMDALLFLLAYFK